METWWPRVPPWTAEKETRSRSGTGRVRKKSKAPATLKERALITQANAAARSDYHKDYSLDRALDDLNVEDWIRTHASALQIQQALHAHAENLLGPKPPTKATKYKNWMGKRQDLLVSLESTQERDIAVDQLLSTLCADVRATLGDSVTRLQVLCGKVALNLIGKDTEFRLTPLHLRVAHSLLALVPHPSMTAQVRATCSACVCVCV